MSAPRDGFPRISIVTASLNQGAFIERTIRSVLDQGYPNLEHIVVDGLSTDDTAAVLDRYPHLIVIREADRGQADAINKGMARATGEILAFLNADDTLEPGTLASVAREIDPAAGRHVVIGRCRFVDEDDRFLGIEHPSGFVDHQRVLAIWLGHWLPQPAIFWSREAGRLTGPLDAAEHLVLDYELFCRMSRHFVFHPVNRVYADYRLHAASKTMGSDDANRLRHSIRVSRRFWGPWNQPLRWRLEASLLRHRLDRVGHGRALMRRAETAWHAGHRLTALAAGLAGAMLAPGVAFYVGLYPQMRRRAAGLAKRLISARLARAATLGGVDAALDRPAPSPQTLAHMYHTAVWSDGWAGPRLILTPETPAPGTAALRLSGHADLSWFPGAQHLTIRVGDAAPISLVLDADGPFQVDLPVPAGSDPPPPIEITAQSWAVPHWFRRNHDFRPLAWRFEALEPVSGP